MTSKFKEVGRLGWRTLDLLVVVYSEDNKEFIREAMRLLPYIYPCDLCRTSLGPLIEFADISKIDSRLGTARFIYALHDMVNLKLQKTSISFDAYINNLNHEKDAAVLFCKEVMSGKDTDKQLCAAFCTIILSLVFEKLVVVRENTNFLTRWI